VKAYVASGHGVISPQGVAAVFEHHMNMSAKAGLQPA
jgi:hypothetical protein